MLSDLNVSKENLYDEHRGSGNYSIKNRGLKRSIQSILSIVEDCWFDFKYGMKTMNWVELDNLDIKSENKKRGGRVSANKSKVFQKINEIFKLSERQCIC